MAFHFMSFHHFISFHFISFFPCHSKHFISFHFTSFHFKAFHFISCQSISCHFISFHFTSFHSEKIKCSVNVTYMTANPTPPQKATSALAKTPGARSGTEPFGRKFSLGHDKLCHENKQTMGCKMMFGKVFKGIKFYSVWSTMIIFSVVRKHMMLHTSDPFSLSRRTS